MFFLPEFASQMEVYIGLEGYTLPSGFIVKELCVLYPNGEYSHHLFKPPSNKLLSEIERRTVRYATIHLNHISYNDGYIPYANVDEILSKYQDCQVFTYGEVSLNFLQSAMPTTVIENIQNRGFKLSAELSDPGCCRIHPPRYCAKAKALAIKSFLSVNRH